jgi:hypothetical protein
LGIKEAQPLSNLSPGGETLKTIMSEEFKNTTTVLKVPLGGFRGL